MDHIQAATETRQRGDPQHTMTLLTNRRCFKAPLNVIQCAALVSDATLFETKLD